MNYKTKVITLDPGHGGNDRANIGSNGYIEADGMLELGLGLRTKLQSMGYTQVFLTRDGDYDVGVRERGDCAAGWHSYLFLSLHSNATGIPGANRSGVEVYESVDLQDEKLAKIMANAIAFAMGIPSLGNKSWESTNNPGEDYLGVIDAAQDGGVEHVLLAECGYHDNPNDEIILLTPGMMDYIADAMANVIDYFMAGRLNELEDKNMLLKIGSKGPDVALLQQNLNSLGYGLAVDGDFGPGTEKAVKHFQQAQGIDADGIVGEITMGRILDMVSRLGSVATNETDFKALYESEKSRADKYESELYALQKKYDQVVSNITDLCNKYIGGNYQ